MSPVPVGGGFTPPTVPSYGVDPIFPLPEPDFLWVYPLIHITSDPANVVVDNEGRWVTTGASVTVMGYVAAPDNKTYTLAEAKGVQCDLVALVPRGTVMRQTDLIIVPPTPIGQEGTYRVTLVRPNASHTRVLIERWSDIPLGNVP